MEKPVSLQKAKAQKGGSMQSTDNKTCIIHVHDTDTKDQTVNSLTAQGFLKIKEVAKLRLGQPDQNTGWNLFRKTYQMSLMKMLMVRIGNATKDSQILIS